ncbi:MAG: UvrD-helicase domain-containing protein [Anaerolineaceae bacterium]|nr:UvrD-helicase domain-containing protein [Anaerolineaceae bacterium]
MSEIMLENNEIQQTIERLNPQQEQAVTAGNGQILVIAGPGSGKTRVLTQRIVYLMRTMGIRPYNILAVTFTNKAAKEMVTRIEATLGETVQGSMWIGTFHAVCARILRREAGALPFDSNFVIMDSDDQLSLIKRIIKDLNIDEKSFKPNALHNAISNCKNELQFPNDVPRSNYREETLFRVYERYQRELLAANSLDFDDLLIWTHKLLSDNPQIRDNYRRRFHHILVDEFQDTNTVQYQLLKLLAGPNGNLFAVGDEDQSIYRWRGADYRNILQFEKDYPNCQKILLEQNYRSVQNVLDAAGSVIDRNKNRTPKKLFSDRGAGELIGLYEAEDDRDEARFVADTIQQLIQNGNAKGGDFAVLYRTNAQSRMFEEAFLHRGMSYRLVGAQRFYGRREVKDMIAYLRLVFNPQDQISLNRVINVPTRGIGAKAQENLNLAAYESQKSAGEVLLDLGRLGPESVYWPEMGRSALTLADFGAKLMGWQEQMNNDPSIVNLMDRIIRETGYQSWLEADNDGEDDRWDNVEELRNMAYEYEERGISEFLQNLALVSDQDTVSDNPDCPTLMTLHAVKGLEFNRVFIIGLDDGVLPHSRSFDDPEEMAEERRLFYVGITRAKNSLTLVRAEQRMSYGQIDGMIRSRFLNDIPQELIRPLNDRASSRNSRSSSQRASRWENNPSWSRGVFSASSSGTSTYTRSNDPIRRTGSAISTKPPVSRSTANDKAETEFHALDKVRHNSWGEGTVLEAKIEGGDEILTIQFKSVGLKKVIAGMTKLVKLNKPLS